MTAVYLWPTFLWHLSSRELRKVGLLWLALTVLTVFFCECSLSMKVNINTDV